MERLKRSPEKFQQLANLANAGNLSAAQAIVTELKLTEADFEKDGGGFIVLLIIFIIILASASEAR